MALNQSYHEIYNLTQHLIVAEASLMESALGTVFLVLFSSPTIAFFNYLSEADLSVPALLTPLN